MNEKLKPCPFCGSKVREGSEESEKCLNAFFCERCEITFEIHRHSSPEYYRSIYNTRDDKAAKIDVLREVLGIIDLNTVDSDKPEWEQFCFAEDMKLDISSRIKELEGGK